MPLHRDPRERLDNIERELDRETVDPELRGEIESKLPGVYQEYISLQSEKAFEQHMARFVTEEHSKRRNGDRGPLCSCSLPTCPLSNGKLPAKLRYNADTVFKQTDGRKRVLQYLHKHRGGEVLHEMLEAWDEREGQLHRDISSIHNRLLKEKKKDLREVPQA